MATTKKTRGARGDGRIYKRTTGVHAETWYREIYVTDPDTGVRKRKSFSGKTKTAAVNAAKAWQKENGGVQRNATPLTVTTAVDNFLDHFATTVESGKRRTNTLVTYRFAARHVSADPVGSKLVAELKAEDVNDMALRMSKGWGMKHKLSTSYIHQIRSLLSQALRAAGCRVVADSDPVSARGKAPNQMTEAEMRAILNTAKARSPQDYALIAVLNMGLRRGEVLGLRWSDIHFDAELLDVREQYLRQGGRPVLGPLKTDESQDTLPMPAHTVEALRSLRVTRPDSGPSDFVFLSEAGTPIDPSNMYHRVKAIGKEAGVDHAVYPHAFRHEMVTTLQRNGVDVARAQRMARHADPRTTLAIYTHLQAEDLRGAAKVLDRSDATG
ncbi:MAG: tyrosine-type recombinase/integrase [Acidimicrobiales bacterium]